MAGAEDAAEDGCRGLEQRDAAVRMDSVRDAEDLCREDGADRMAEIMLQRSADSLRDRAPCVPISLVECSHSTPA
eukprot:1311024-Amorphochlora_amoeboformis.AAC.1